MSFLSDLFGTNFDAPAPRNVAQEMTDSINAQVSTAPQVYAARQQFDPLYTTLGLQDTNDTLNGVNGQPGMLSIEAGAAPQISAMTNTANTSA